MRSNTWLLGVPSIPQRILGNQYTNVPDFSIFAAKASLSGVSQPSQSLPDIYEYFPRMMLSICIAADMTRNDNVFPKEPEHNFVDAIGLFNSISGRPCGISRLRRCWS